MCITFTKESITDRDSMLKKTSVGQYWHNQDLRPAPDSPLCARKGDCRRHDVPVTSLYNLNHHAGTETNQINWSRQQYEFKMLTDNIHGRRKCQIASQGKLLLYENTSVTINLYAFHTYLISPSAGTFVSSPFPILTHGQLILYKQRMVPAVQKDTWSILDQCGPYFPFQQGHSQNLETGPNLCCLEILQDVLYFMQGLYNLSVDSFSVILPVA